METGKFNRESVLILIGSVILCNLAGVIGTAFTITGPGSWYSTLVKPSYNPPGWVFAPVWTLLYILMGISLYVVLMEGRKGKDIRLPLALFGAQLVLNVLWSYAFFGMQSPLASLVVIVTLWVSIVMTIAAFYRVREIAAWLLLPYLGWVSFASVLNYGIYALNV